MNNFTRSKEEVAADLLAAAKRLAKAKRHQMSVRTDKPLTERHVNMANILSRSAQSLKLIEKRVVAVALAKTDSIPGRDLENAKISGWSVRIMAEEYADQFKITLDAAYQQLQDAKILMERQLRFFVEDKRDKRGVREVIINWCGMYQYNKGEGWAEFSFTPQIAPLLLGLRGEKTPFTSYQLSRVANLKLVSSWRLYECFLSWRVTGRWEPTIEEFCYTMDIPESYKKDFGAIRRRVIDPAMKELIIKNNMIITLELRKSGRKVIGLDFKFKENPQGMLL